MSTYGQYCPLALAAEILGERWNLLIISRIVDGCCRFNEIHRGLPKISATLLSRRLDDLARAGVIVRAPLKNSQGHDYRLTDAGRALAPLIDQIAVWGQEWAREMTLDDLDPTFLLWSMHNRINTNAMPEGRTVIQFIFTGAPADLNRFWLMNTDGEVEMCLKYPGFDPDVEVRADLRTFIEAWRGFRNLKNEISKGSIIVEGDADLARRFPEWLQLSAFAPTPRRRPGRERSLADDSCATRP
jgi:DNA-binding HxlR family transcriptional regulator